jgi:hypothetical protein
MLPFLMLLIELAFAMCIRDDEGRFVIAKTERLIPLLDVDLGETLGLLSALYWMCDL